MARIIPFPVDRRDAHGVVHVMGDSVDGFRISHESASGESWGSFLGPFRDGQKAIAAAYALNRDQYDGACDVSVCDAAAQHANPHVGLPSWPGDF